jgi:putative transposase
MNLAVNVVIEWLSDGSRTQLERVLFIDPSGTDMVTIDIDPENTKALPIWRKCEELSVALAADDARILDTDPYEQPAQALSDEGRKHRDEIWEIIRPLIEGANKEGWSKEHIFIAEKRGPMIAEVSESSKRAKRLIYTYLRRYWQGGQIKNALIPHYHKSRGKGKERQVKDQKRGRPRGVSKEAHAPEMQTPLGVNVTPEIRKKFERGIRLFYENQDGRTLREAWQLTKEHFFHIGFELQNGVLVPLLPVLAT